jgi:predicted nucleic acid-binding protein
VIYVDTSVLVPLFVSEPGSRAVTNWYAAEPGELVATAWCATEFASALGIKQRTGAIDATQAQEAWGRFKRLVNADLRLLTVEPSHFHRAAELTLDASSALRAGDALHLACAEAAGATWMATLDDALARNARRFGIQSLDFKGVT